MTRFQNWFRAQPPRGQWVVGCAGVAVVVSVCLYSLGLASFLARPALIATPPAATIVMAVPTVERPTFVAPTVAPTFILPASTLQATPTQAPIPTRAPPTETPTPLLGPDGLPLPITDTPDATLYFQLAQTPQP
ncbi:MAG: hypothetical protein IT331_25075 [Anaerolineae bacterium]|nr:hypothetical protein [Anaerolineae bacterium]